MIHSFLSGRRRLFALALSVLVLLCGAALQAQSSASKLEGTIVDQHGKALKGASVTIRTATGTDVRRTETDSQGHYVVSDVPAGRYTVEISDTGFATEERQITVGQSGSQTVSASLAVASVSEQVVVEAEDNSSIAVQLAPVKALLDAGSARTEITSQYVREFTSPVTDFADIIQAAPGTVSYTTNGIGNGQAKIFFRGFVDDD